MLNSEEPKNYLHLKNDKRARITPTRFWSYFEGDSFENHSIISQGNFSEVIKVRVKDSYDFTQNKTLGIYVGQEVAVKDPKGEKHDVIQEVYSLSQEISCTVIFHPFIVKYIGGVNLGHGHTQRVGVVMELMKTDLRAAIKENIGLKNLSTQMKIAREIASGMNYLHSLNPFVLVTKKKFNHF